jgi:hypothetical protein
LTVNGGLQLRRITPEILDSLRSDDQRAIASRRDLRRLNRIMGQARIMAGMLQSHLPRPPRRILEIGGGDGSLSLAVARRLAPYWRDVTLTIVDLASIVPGETRTAFASLGWTVEAIAADVFQWAAEQPPALYDAIIANLVLHHFRDEQLLGLFRQAAGLAPVFLAAEPQRAGFALSAARMTWVIGCNDVTRHDAVVSVRAGFRDAELTQLWPAGATVLEERQRGLFTHVFAARAAF